MSLMQTNSNDWYAGAVTAKLSRFEERGMFEKGQKA